MQRPARGSGPGPSAGIRVGVQDMLRLRHAAPQPEGRRRPARFRAGAAGRR